MDNGGYGWTYDAVYTCIDPAGCRIENGRVTGGAVRRTEPTATPTPTSTPEPTATPTPAPTDYDTDDDGLIEISNLSQLNAVRWDSDGDSRVSSSGRVEYFNAFPGAEGSAGCPNTGCEGYELVADLDFDTNGSGDADAGDAYWNGGAGWEPIDFRSTFDGGDHTISNLYIDRKNEDDVGLFGTLRGGRVQGVGLVNAQVRGSNHVGGLVGLNIWESTITASYATGSVNGSDGVGGLVGLNIWESTITASYATGSVNGSDGVGGLVGANSRESTITASYATGSVNGSDENVGGLVGLNIWESTITASYATGSVNGSDGVGGLVGLNIWESTITASYATGSVNGSDGVGGLVGANSRESTITASYATGSVNGSDENVGGLVGLNIWESTITASYATGSVNGSDGVGGLVGLNSRESTITASYWDIQATGQSSSDGGVGKATAELQSPTGYAGIYADWNVDVDGDGSSDDPWDFGTTSQYPALKHVDSSDQHTSSPTATFTPTPTSEQEGADVTCRAGLQLSPGDQCSYEGFSIRIREDGAAVLDGNIGGISMGNTVMNAQSISLNRFRATRRGSTWTIESLPGTSNTGSSAATSTTEPIATPTSEPTPTPVQEPVSITEFNRASLSTRLSMFEEGRIAKCRVGLVLPRDGFCIDPDADSIRPPNTVRFLAAHLSDGSGLVMGEAWVFGRSPGTITLIGTNVEFGWISGSVYQSRSEVDLGSITAEKQGVDWVITHLD